MYKVNDKVIYGSSGVCRIEDVRKHKFGENETEYYILKPLTSNASTVYVPVGNLSLEAKMRPMMSADEIRELVKSSPEEPIDWVEEGRARKEYYKTILDRGDRSELIRLIKTVEVRRKERADDGKKLWATDENAMTRAVKILYDEFSEVLKIKQDELLPFINGEFTC